MKSKVRSTVGELDHPHFVLWNSCGSFADGCPLAPGKEYVGGVPDTFTYEVNFHATVPVTVRIMSTDEFVCWETKLCSAHWWGWEDRTSLMGGVFYDAEGCAGYLAVFSSDQYGTLFPDVRVTRNPASESSGVCR